MASRGHTIHLKLLLAWKHINHLKIYCIFGHLENIMMDLGKRMNVSRILTAVLNQIPITPLAVVSVCVWAGSGLDRKRGSIHELVGAKMLLLCHAVLFVDILKSGSMGELKCTLTVLPSF